VSSVLGKKATWVSTFDVTIYARQILSMTAESNCSEVYPKKVGASGVYSFPLFNAPKL